ncbi:MAG: class I SAM-dependent methyltransferase [bacterium]|nr:class I SAM-dependent methyltransferase [bacterium]
MGFRDFFSERAAEYRSFRPQYPAPLFAYLASLPEQRDLVWDCGTGSGQAAIALARHFRRVIAGDASKSQVFHARERPGVAYAVVEAGQAAIRDRALDLVVVAQAAHWFHFERFYAEVRRVLKPRGVLAIWCYDLPEISPAIDAIVRSLYRDTLGGFWSPERRLIDARYETLPFPFPQLPVPGFDMETEWTLEQFVGYIRTWSALKAYGAKLGRDPVAAILEELGSAWGEMSRSRRLHWPLTLKVGRN